MVTIQELASAVREMRLAQKGFFSSRPRTQARQDYLVKSKKYERQVDTLLERINNSGLFG